MIHEIFPVGPLQCNCSVVGDEQTREALVIDPGDDIDEVLASVQRHGLTVKQIVVTHAHIDHVGGALKLKHLTGAPILLNENDLPLLKMMEAQAAWLGVPTPEVAAPEAILDDGMRVGLERYPANVLFTPGHTQGSVCLHFEPLNIVLAGDTLFAGSIGRTDLPGGNSRQILDSIMSRLLVLPDETRVIPGHGPATTIGAERNGNPFLNLR